MLEKPDILDGLIIDRLQDQYEINVAALTFLPLGADMGTAVYRIDASDGRAYFLKLRKGLNEIVVAVPLFLKSHGVNEIIAPIATKSSRGWADFGEYNMILYPFVDGQNGFEVELSDDHKRKLGKALRLVHSIELPPELRKLIPIESFSPRYRESIRSFQEQIEIKTYIEPVAAKLAEFMKCERDRISHLIERAETLALQLKSETLDLVLCHTDIHGGNILLSRSDELFIVDWDAPLFAPKERDLMFVGGGIDQIWKTKRDEDYFYQGYGQTKINWVALAYYRYERIIVDLVEFCQQLLLTDEGGADRLPAYQWFTFNFEPGQTFDRAEKTMHRRLV